MRKKKKGRKTKKGRKKKRNRKNFKRFTDLNKKFTDLLDKVTRPGFDREKPKVWHWVNT